MEVEPRGLNSASDCMALSVTLQAANEALSPDNSNLHEGEQLVKHVGLVDILRRHDLTAHVMGTTDDAFSAYRPILSKTCFRLAICGYRQTTFLTQEVDKLPSEHHHVASCSEAQVVANQLPYLLFTPKSLC